ncbi:MAG: pectate lyase, partial [Geminicoccaceae bacterium]
YVWRYSTDLTYRRGEALTTPSQGWVQPPGTPAVGLAFLEAYQATDDRYYLDAAADAAHALAATQLQSGGWFYGIEFDPQARKAWCYRVPPGGCTDGELTPQAKENRHRDATTIDDNVSQSALELLMKVDALLRGEAPDIRAAVAYGLEKFMDAQYPNGAWPQRFDWKVPDRLTHSAWRARYPARWPREFHEIEVREFYALNDNVVRDIIRMFVLAHRIYGEEEYLASAMRAGDFLLSAQMPGPQPAWAQLYNSDMEPIWGRKFEPPAIASRESGGAIQALLELYLYTGKRRYLESLPAAVGWLEASRLSEDEWARFYELRTNRPLYMTKDYHLTYAGDETPRHYGFEGSFELPEALRLFHEVADQGRDAYLAASAPPAGEPAPGKAIADLASSVEQIVADLDQEGRWVEKDRINSATFIENVDVLARYLAAVRGRPAPSQPWLP